MKLRSGRLGTTIFLILAAVVVLRADMAPEDGYTRVQTRIILDTTDDLAAYRFFLVSSDLAKEIFVKKGEKTTVGEIGGGVRYRSGTIVAIPRVSLSDFGRVPKGDRLAALLSSVADFSPAGTIKLLTQDFALDVPDADAGKVTDTTYRIEKTPDGVKATAAAGSTKSNINAAGSGKSAGMTGWSLIAGGTLMSLAFITFGLLVFRRSTKISEQ